MTLYRAVAAVMCLTFLGLCLGVGVWAAWRVIRGDDSSTYGCAPWVGCVKG